jgi:hypothetical protein
MTNAVFWDVTPCGSYTAHRAEDPRRRHSSSLGVCIVVSWEFLCFHFDSSTLLVSGPDYVLVYAIVMIVLSVVLCFLYHQHIRIAVISKTGKRQGNKRYQILYKFVLLY